MPKKSTVMCACADCTWKGQEGELAVPLADIPNLLSRINAGGTVPAGECPKCGALAYLTPPLGSALGVWADFNENGATGHHCIGTSDRSGTPLAVTCGTKKNALERAKFFAAAPSLRREIVETVKDLREWDGTPDAMQIIIANAEECLRKVPPLPA